MPDIPPDQQDANKRAAQLIGKISSSGDVDALDDVLAEDIVARWPGLDSVRGREAYKETIRMFRTASTDFTVEDHDAVAEGNTVSRHFTARGTHEGKFLGIQPTGNTIEGRGMNIAYFEDGEVIEEITCIDMLDIFQQLGVIERPGE